MGMKQDEEVPNTKEIQMFFQCALCMEEMGSHPGETPESFARFNAGWTRWGLQLWCVRHDCNVIHIDFEGKSPFIADTTRKRLEIVG